MKTLLTITFVLLSGIILAQTNSSSVELPNEQLLYPEGIKHNPIEPAQNETFTNTHIREVSLCNRNRIYSNISIPTYTLFPADKAKNKHIGVIIFPGGGFVVNCIDWEGTDVALWLASQGITCMVVKYRTIPKDENGKTNTTAEIYREAVSSDAREGIIKLKSLAESLDFDTENVGVMGFSAGARLSSWITVSSTETNAPWKPAFTGLIYGGDGPESLDKVTDKSKLPPIFIAYGRDDSSINNPVLRKYYDIIISEVEHSEMHVYSKGRHGMGLGNDAGNSANLWKNNFYNWLLDNYN